MASQLTLYAPQPATVPTQPAQAESDDRIIQMWLARLAPSSQRVYRHALRTFFAFNGPSTLANLEPPSIG